MSDSCRVVVWNSRCNTGRVVGIPGRADGEPDSVAAMEWFWIFLLLAVVVTVFGFGVVVTGRRRSLPGEQVVGTAAVTEPEPAAEPETAAEPVVETATEPAVARSLRDRLGKARATLSGAFAGVLGRSAVTDETWDDLEEALLRADVGLAVTDALLGGLRERVRNREIEGPEALLDALRFEMTARLEGSDRTLHFDADARPNVWMFVGVNGVGKTTTIGKLAKQQIGSGSTVLLAAGDTFRAAAAEQLGTWAERSGADFVRGAEGGDPSAVVFDGVARAAARDIDLVLADTAGRLHTKTNLMEELRKVRRVAEKGDGTVTETLLVIDATTGQNGLTQAREFREATDVTGVVLTKLDGSAKGGIVFAIETELGIPVKLVGVGEQIDDLVPFRPDEFVDALFERP
jgi:fused signal recognition particle receptor